MPSSITHELIAEAAAEEFPEEIRRLAGDHPDYFFLGAQGPDLFFFYRFIQRKEQNFGKFLHRHRPLECFEYFAKKVREGNDRMRAYIAGYITHYATDVAFHPFVYAYLERLNAGKLEHQQIESDWDVYFLRSRRGREVECYDFPFSGKRIAREGILFRLFAPLCLYLERDPLDEDKLASALTAFELYLKFFHGECYETNESWLRVEKFFRAKSTMSRLFPRKTPNADYLGGDDFETLSGGAKNADELFDRAVKDSIKLVGILFSCAEKDTPLPKEEFSKHFLTGKQFEK